MECAGERPNLLIIGTSNSIQRHGYRVALEGQFDRIENLAVGASTSIMHGLRRREISVRDGFAIFDHCVNEARLHRAKLLSEKIQRASLDSFLAICGEQSLNPIILIMPSHWQFARNGPVRDSYLRYAQERQVPWFDGFVLTERLYGVRPDLAHHGYGPGAHSDPEVAQPLGHALVTAMGKTSDWSTRETMSSRLDSSHVEGDDLLVRKSGLDQRAFLILKEGESITLPVRGDIVGVAFNAGATNAVIESDGYRKLVRSSLYRWKDYCLVIWPMVHPLAAGDQVTVRCLAGDEVVNEPNDHMPKGEPDLGDPTLELGALITLEHGMARHPYSEGILDMVSTLSDDDILQSAKSIPHSKPELPA